MKKVSFLWVGFVFLVLMAGCAAGIDAHPAAALGATATPGQESLPAISQGDVSTPTSAETLTEHIDLIVNPLTGLGVEDPDQLDRRPVMVKVQNAPREDRPHFGLSAADIVFEYAIEFGDTRFAAVYYSQFPEKIGPIRSARHVDIHLVRGYKAVLIFGGAYEDLMDILVDSDFGNRLVREGPNTKPALYRYDPDGKNYLLADLNLIDPILEKYGIDNTIQDLSGLTFSENPEQPGEPAAELYIRFSGGSYNQWKYDGATGKYLRFSETHNDLDDNNPQLAPLVDRTTEAQISADNVVILQAVYNPIIKNASSEVYDIQLLGQGNAYLARNGTIIPLTWMRQTEEDVITLVDSSGEAYPLKPGQTWFEILNSNSKVQSVDDDWVFRNWMP